MKAPITSMTPPGATLPHMPLPSVVATPASVPTPLPALSDPLDEMNARQPAATAGAAIKEEPTSLDQLRRFASGGYLYALIDATDQTLVPYRARQLGPGKAISLFSGTAKEQYWQVAPYLFHLDPELLDWTIAKLWKEPWGIFIITKATFEDIRVHLKKFLLAQLPDGKVWYFRYYDPRILKAYLPACNPWELQKFFGPIRAFAIAGGEQEKPTMVQGLNNPLPPTLQPEATVWWKIRPEQHKEFNKAAEKSFIERCIQFLRAKLPDEVAVLPTDVLQYRVELGVARARTYGITWRSSLLTFVTLMFEVGPYFDRHSRIREIFADFRLHPNEKPSWLFKMLDAQQWQSVREIGRSGPWPEPSEGTHV